MKQIKKTAGLLLAMVLLLAFGITANAETISNGSVTINKPDNMTLVGRSFEFYRILNATVSKDGDSTHINYTFNDEWKNWLQTTFAGAGEAAADVTVDDVLGKLKDYNAENMIGFAKDVTNAISSVNPSATKTAVDALSADSLAGNGSYTVENLPVGYYLVYETTPVAGEGVTDKDNARMQSALQVVSGTASFTLKSDKPSVTKKVWNDAAETGGEGSWGDATDANLNETVTFQLKGDIPDMTGYSTYKYVFHDTMSKGLTWTPNQTVKVKIGGKDYTLPEDENKFSVTVNAGTDNTQITVTFANLMDAVKSVQGNGYDASEGVVIEYTATLNEQAVIGNPGNPNKVSLEYANDPYTATTGMTPEDEVYVFTYEIDATKIDGSADDRTTLAGAEFKLYTQFSALASNDQNETEKTKTVDEKTYYYYGKVTTAADGKITFSRLREGKYLLVETKAPDGYSMLTHPVIITISASYQQSADDSTVNKGTDANGTVTFQSLDASSVTLKGETLNSTKTTGSIAFDVANYSGPTLPETGGIGTTLFTIIGLVLMLGAAVLLVARKKMQNK